MCDLDLAGKRVFIRADFNVLFQGEEVDAGVGWLLGSGCQNHQAGEHNVNH